MSNRIILEIELNQENFTVSLDSKSRKNLNIRIKPNNVIAVSKPAHFSQKKLLQYLKDHREWILDRSHKVNLLHESRNSHVDSEWITIFGEEVKASDFRNVKEELEMILSGYIDQKRDYYDQLLNKKPMITIKKMKGKWGYCIPSKNQLFFNIKLVHYPKEVIDYVILHEYTHLKIPNHSREFYDFIKKDMPNYKRHIKYLKEH